MVLAGSKIKMSAGLNSLLEAVRKEESASRPTWVVGRIQFLVVVGLKFSFLC